MPPKERNGRKEREGYNGKHDIGVEVTNKNFSMNAIKRPDIDIHIYLLYYVTEGIHTRDWLACAC
jgi:hypothetical protein